MHGAAGGAPNGNRNALKHGEFTAETRALKKEIAALARMARESDAGNGIARCKSARVRSASFVLDVTVALASSMQTRRHFRGRSVHELAAH